MGLEEEWRPIKDFEDRYLISNLGRIKIIRTGNIMATFQNKDGYERATLWDGSHYHKKSVHILVAESFLEKPITNKILEVDHIDCNPKNNILSNLRWLTREENLNRSFDLGHQRLLKKPIEQYDLKNNLINTYESVNEAYRQTNIRHISEAARGIRKTAGGYIWKYIEKGDD